MSTATRRTAVAGARACGLLTACGGGGADGRGADASAATGPLSAATGGPRPVPTGGIPVGGSTVVMADTVSPAVVARPTRTAYAAHTAICTHRGRAVTPGRGLELDGPCHGSRSDAATGRVLGGPATRPLRARPFTVRGDVLPPHTHEDSDDGDGRGSSGGVPEGD
ncbi:ubiquinol-cytochrome c reductase iron-sulfur subunit [Actinacidiphila sp. ITFR-21]|uniref:QcrA and Rieske domain-containing protein n=1 Tax=Actinacidiphila sp. ITFR-21 TaxID=3075199 RepID=UPI00288C15D9|nr:Rieske (2Fe-2S) protein [Streptomyces sp. ITFR-21]WNI18006.1 Rieske (2Fe-2S) protein [Streptomyces sp. ITFR-21]